MASLTQSIDMSLSRLQERLKDRAPGVLQFMGSQGVGHDLATEQQKQPYKRREQGHQGAEGLLLRSLWQDR